MNWPRLGPFLLVGINMERIFFDEQRLFMNSEEVRGIQSIQISQSLNLTPVSCLGTGFFNIESTEPLNGQLSVSQILVNTGEAFDSITGNFSGVFAYGDSDQEFAVQFDKSVINSYRLAAEINSLVTIDTNHTLYGGGYSGNYSPPAQLPLSGEYIARPHLIETNIPFRNRDAVQGVTYEVEVTYKETYFLGSGIPELDITPPIVITTTVNANVSDYEFENFQNLCGLTKTDLEIELTNCDGQRIKKLTAPDSILDSISFNGKVLDQLRMVAVYKSFNNSINGLII